MMMTNANAEKHSSFAKNNKHGNMYLIVFTPSNANLSCQISFRDTPGVIVETNPAPHDG